MAQIRLTIRMIGIGVLTARHKVTHLLLPASGHAADDERGSCAHVPEHFARLYLGEARRKETPEAPTPPQPAYIDVNHCAVRIVDRTFEPTKEPPHADDLVPVRDAMRRSRFRRGLFGPKPDPRRLRGRVELHLDACVDTLEAGDFEFVDGNGKGEPSFQAKTYTRWTADVDDRDLAIEVVPFRPGRHAEPITIVPQSRAGEPVCLDFFHVPFDELPPNPEPRVHGKTEIKHFHLYYRLFKFDGPEKKLFFDGARGGSSVLCPKGHAY